MTVAGAVSIIGAWMPTQVAVGMRSLLMSHDATTCVLTVRFALALLLAGASAAAREAQLHTSIEAKSALKRRALSLLDDAVERVMTASRATTVPFAARTLRCPATTHLNLGRYE